MLRDARQKLIAEQLRDRLKDQTPVADRSRGFCQIVFSLHVFLSFIRSNDGPGNQAYRLLFAQSLKYALYDFGIAVAFVVGTVHAIDHGVAEVVSHAFLRVNHIARVRTEDLVEVRDLILGIVRIRAVDRHEGSSSIV